MRFTPRERWPEGVQPNGPLGDQPAAPCDGEAATGACAARKTRSSCQTPLPYVPTRSAVIFLSSEMAGECGRTLPNADHAPRPRVVLNTTASLATMYGPPEPGWTYISFTGALGRFVPSISLHVVPVSLDRYTCPETTSLPMNPESVTNTTPAESG